MKNLFKALAFCLFVGMAPVILAQEPSNVNINTADVETLSQLPGIGSTKAEAIIADRAANGLYETADDLTRISGIGEATVEGLRDRVAF